MKKQIAKLIGSGIFASFLAGTIFMIGFLIIIDMQTPNHYDDGRPKMNCFGGLQYGIAIGIQILIALLNLPAFLILFRQIRRNKYFTFLAFFAGYILYLFTIFASLSEFSGEEYVIIIPWVNFLVWIFYYFKLRKMININDDN
ncbi:hypothetical protein [Chryseobacterium sp. 5_R23647]|uniref:hypothetical protein n=1 Tax=Chryseobacterium sp. 5_R23647 TaxID=2258964 RepID=UPI000E23A903|nr:hypothetical protein [Chryseobacterium sp. 5_R23647]REC43248.1 hypothetical protein DRF69_08940 [Chryseobacterium sp. 5_R23647]